jgi:uncharacterized membrane protein YcjF (UPF0283 family)
MCVTAPDKPDCGPMVVTVGFLTLVIGIAVGVKLKVATDQFIQQHQWKIIAFVTVFIVVCIMVLLILKKQEV